MIQYGKKKRGSGKIHPHNECSICSENSVSKKGERRDAKKTVEEEVVEMEWGRRKRRIR